VEVAAALLFAFLAWWAMWAWHSSEATQNWTKFPGALDEVAGPIPQKPGGYLTVTAAFLNKSQPGEVWLGYRVHYVEANQDSTGPAVVSVHLISATVWADAALGSSGRCYAELVTSSTNGM
jgi:hypothetical protein